MSLVARIFQGIGDAMIGVCVPSMIAIQFPHKQEIYLGYAGLAMGLGLCAGPLLGALVYLFLNYVQTFYFFAVYILLTGIIAMLMIPNALNKRNFGD